MKLVSISVPPQIVISYDGVNYEGPVFDVPQNVGELLMGRADLWRLPTQAELDGDDVDHDYDGRFENRGRPEHPHDGRTRRRGAEALAEVPVPDYDQQVAAEIEPPAPGSTEPTDLEPFAPKAGGDNKNDDAADKDEKDSDPPESEVDAHKPAAKKTAAKKTAAHPSQA